jgi:hypothetical protein
LLSLCLASASVLGEEKEGGAPPGTPADQLLLTIFLRHDQSRTLAEISAHLQETGFWEEFPPTGVSVESWYVVMGVGQVVTLRLPPERLRAVNLAVERHAWGAFRSEFYPTYDFRAIAAEQREQAKKAQ